MNPNIEVAAAAPQAQLIITMNAGGQVQVNGPIANRMLCYAMLEFARDAIRDYKPAEKPAIIPINGFMGRS
jgi:hypothetical protein